MKKFLWKSNYFLSERFAKKDGWRKEKSINVDGEKKWKTNMAVDCERESCEKKMCVCVRDWRRRKKEKFMFKSVFFVALQKNLARLCGCAVG